MDFGLYSVNFDFNAIQLFFRQDPVLIVLGLMAIFGWLILIWLLVYAGIYMYLEYKQDIFKSKWKWVLLAIDVPLQNVQTPMAVEQLFNHLYGAFNDPSIAESFGQGFRQHWFSFEIISIEGYIQFLIRTESKFRDLVESAVYAQYPDAEVVEVEDYVNNVPNKYPNPDYDIWAADFGLTEHWSHPLRTYEEFEHRMAKDVLSTESLGTFKDPMGTFLESFSRLGPGEQMWFQIIVQPVSNHWKEEVIKKIEEMTGGSKKTGYVSTLSDKMSDFPIKTLEAIGDQVFGREASSAEEKEKEEKKELSPGQSTLIEGMIKKIQKIGFQTKMRGIYIARKEAFRPDSGIHALVGAITQFNVPNANCLAPLFKTTSPSYFFKERRRNYRKSLLFKAYKKRKAKSGANQFILNIMELATIWHFPTSHVKTPLVQKAAGKQAEPPSGLPVESILNPSLPVAGEEKEKPENKISGKAIKTDSGEVFIRDDQRFG